ncbi:MAG: hypothetical protein HY856_13575 [Burkholderiales bacterium]|nr:hypothetical protein [Burkholderiales bacterium]
MVRYACEADIPLIMRLCEREHAASKWRDVPFEPHAAENTIRQFLSLIGRTLFVSEAGYLAGLVQPFGFSQYRVALEYAWYAEDGSGLALLRRFEEWAHRMGAVEVVAHNYLNDPRLEAVMAKRRGYSLMGSTLSKRLEH